MSTDVIVTLISGLLTLAGVIISNNRAARDTDLKLDKKQAVTDTKLEELTREVRQHNDFAKRIPTIEAEFKNLKDRVDKLEKLHLS